MLQDSSLKLEILCLEEATGDKAEAPKQEDPVHQPHLSLLPHKARQLDHWDSLQTPCICKLLQQLSLPLLHDILR